MATIGCSDQIYKAYVNLNLKYATTIIKNTKFLETLCLHITDSTVTKSIVTNIITPQNTTLELIDAQKDFSVALEIELNRIASQFISYGGLRMFFLITPLENVITKTHPIIDTVLDVIGYVKSNANSLATVATLMHFTETFDEFAVLYEKTQDKLATNPSKNVCLFYDTDRGFMNDYLQFLSLTYSKTENEFLTQNIIFRRHTVDNHENVISSVEENTTMRRNLLSFISCDANGGFIGYYTSGAMNNTNSFWVAQVRYDIQFYIMKLVSKNVPYNALSVNEKVSVGTNCLVLIQNALIRVLEYYKSQGVILEYYQAIVPDQTQDSRNSGEVKNVQVVYAGINIIVAVNGEISTDIQSAIIGSGASNATVSATSTIHLFPKEIGVLYESWGGIVKSKDNTDTENLVSLINSEVA